MQRDLQCEKYRRPCISEEAVTSALFYRSAGYCHVVQFCAFRTSFVIASDAAGIGFQRDCREKTVFGKPAVSTHAVEPRVVLREMFPVLVVRLLVPAYRPGLFHFFLQTGTPQR